MMMDEGRTERLVLDERVLELIGGNELTDQSC